MHYDTLDLKKEVEVFAGDMKRGLAGGDSTLLMIPTYLETGKAIPYGESVLALDAGGTNFRVSVLHLNGVGEPMLEVFENRPMPGTKGAITADTFFETIVDAIAPLVPKTQKIGFCFSYPAETTPELDARIIRMAKEVTINGAEGLLIGEELNKALARRGLPACKVVLLNDTAAGMLGGLAQTQARVYDDYIGFILGTGTNTCYIENTENIPKLPARGRHGRMVVNQESGGYGRIAQGEVDRELDSESANPGKQKLEKMVSGAYFGAILRRLIDKACNDGLFSAAFRDKIATVDKLLMQDVGDFCENPYSGFFSELAAGNDDDRLTLFELIDALFDRAARITIIQIAGILTQTGAGQSPLKPVCVVAEGTFFTKARTFRAKFDAYVKCFLGDEMGRYIELVSVQNATLTGSAAAVLIS